MTTVTGQQTKLLFEIFEKFKEAKSDSERQAILLSHNCYELKTALMINYHPAIQFDLPEGTPPFQKDNGDPDHSLARTASVLRDFPQLLKSNRTKNQEQKELKFISLLESVNEKEAEILILLKEKKLHDKYPTLTIQLVRQIFGNIA